MLRSGQTVARGRLLANHVGACRNAKTEQCGIDRRIALKHPETEPRCSAKGVHHVHRFGNPCLQPDHNALDPCLAATRQRLQPQQAFVLAGLAIASPSFLIVT